MKKWLFINIAILFSCLTLSAQQQEQVSDTLEVYFRQGYSTWEPNFKNNARRMEAFVERFKKLREDQVMSRISKIHIIAGCSPEGTWALNQRLSRNRAKRIRGVLKQYITLPDSVVVEDAVGINWQELRRMVADDPNVPHREEVLDIIDHTPELHVNERGQTVELRKQRLVWRFGGEAWRYMYSRFFPTLRSFNLQIVVEWEHYEAVTRELKMMSRDDIEQKNLSVPASVPPPPPVITPPAPKPPFYMAVKTNLLYDAVIIPNIGVEFYLGKQFSLAANWQYAWWKSDPSSWYHRTYGGDLEVRRYFGRKAAEKPLQGWHAGVYGQMVTYDFEWGGRGYLGDRWSWAAGASIGYSLPVRHRMNIDFTLGIGYLWGEYKEYLPIDDCYVWQVTKQRHWFGPTKAEVSLVWLIGRGNINKGKKGGRR